MRAKTTYWDIVSFFAGVGLCWGWYYWQHVRPTWYATKRVCHHG